MQVALMMPSCGGEWIEYLIQCSKFPSLAEEILSGRVYRSRNYAIFRPLHSRVRRMPAKPENFMSQSLRGVIWNDLDVLAIDFCRSSGVMRKCDCFPCSMKSLALVMRHPRRQSCREIRCVSAAWPSSLPRVQRSQFANWVLRLQISICLRP